MVELEFSPSSLQRKSIWQTAIDNRAFLEVQEPSREVLAHYWRKKKLRLDAMRRPRGTVWLSCIISPTWKHISVPGEPFSFCDFSKVRPCKWTLIISSYTGHCGRLVSLLSHLEDWVTSRITGGLWVAEKTAARAQNGMYKRGMTTVNHVKDIGSPLEVLTSAYENITGKSPTIGL